MKKQTLFLALISVLILSACSKPSERKNEEKDTSSVEIIKEIENEAATDRDNLSGKTFFIETIQLEDKNNQIVVEKSGRLMGSQEIMLSSQVGGRAYSLPVKEGDKVGIGRVLVGLSDTVGNYGIMVQRANVGLERARLTYNQNKLQLDNAITNTKHSLDQSINTYNIAQTQAAQQIRQAELQLDQVALSGGSAVALEIERIRLEDQRVDNELDKQFDTIKNTFQVQHLQSKQLQKNIYDLADQLFGITILYQFQADTYKNQLGNLLPGIRIQTRGLINPYKKREETLYEMSEIPVDSDLLLSQIDTIHGFYQESEYLLSQLERLVDNTTDGGGLTIIQLQQFVTSVDTLIAQHQAQEASRVQYTNQVESLRTEQQNPVTTDSIDQQVAIVKKNAENNMQNAQLGYDTTRTQVDNNLFQVDLAKTMAQEAYDLAIRNRDSQLALLNVGIKDAQVNLADAQRQYAKLTITSPINAIVSEILVDKGADIAMGTPVVKLVGTESNEVTITVDEQQIDLVEIGQELDVVYQSKQYTGKITSVGIVADQTFGYPVTIKVDDITSSLGGTVKVALPIQTINKTIPLKAVEIIGNSKGYIYIRNNGQAEQTQIDVGTVWGDQIEILTEIQEDKEIILTDMSGYDAESFTLEKK